MVHVLSLTEYANAISSTEFGMFRNKDVEVISMDSYSIRTELVLVAAKSRAHKCLPRVHTAI